MAIQIANTIVPFFMPVNGYAPTRSSAGHKWLG
jgi:hypothetical protein